MLIGKFTYDGPRYDGLTGTILGYPHPISFEQQSNAGQLMDEGPRTPDYKVYVKSGDLKIKVGAAWTEKDKKNGSTYYSIILNLGLLFPEPIYAKLQLSRDEPGVFSLFRDTPEEKAAYRAKQSRNESAQTQLTPT